MDKEILILVDANDTVIGTEIRERCHLGDGILHRAIATFIFNDEVQLLIALRAKSKTLWPAFWDASCCTHVYPDETYEQAGERRLPQELGFSCPVKFLTKFQYQAKYGDIGSENEMCALLIGKYNGEVKPNQTEVASYKWIDIDRLKKDVFDNSDAYTPWLRVALAEYVRFLPKTVDPLHI